jgi:hypothetical protein
MKALLAIVLLAVLVLLAAQLIPLVIGLAAASLSLALYFLPSIIAISRDHRNAGPIFLLNLLLGWTFIGWVVALVWSCTAQERSRCYRDYYYYS